MRRSGVVWTAYKISRLHSFCESRTFLAHEPHCSSTCSLLTDHWIEVPSAEVEVFHRKNRARHNISERDKPNTCSDCITRTVQSPDKNRTQKCVIRSLDRQSSHLPGSLLAIVAHLLPWILCRWAKSTSSSAERGVFFRLGSRWFLYRRRQLLPERWSPYTSCTIRIRSR